MRLILVRHARSMANHEERLQDKLDEWYDTDLHDIGLVQAKEVAIKLKDEKIDEIYASPLKRAMQTANEINKFHNLEIKVKKRLKEKRAKESVNIFAFRCLRFFNSVRKKKDKNILVVTHNGVILALLGISTLSRKKGEALARDSMGKIANTSITIIERKGKDYVPTLIGSAEHVRIKTT